MATALRDYAKQQGLNVDYDALTKKVTLGNKTLAPNQLEALGGQLVGGAWQFGDVAKLNTLTGAKPTTPTPTPTLAPSQAPMSQEDIQRMIADQKKALAMDKFNQQFKQTEGRLTQERAGIDPRFLEATGRTMTQEAMSRRAIENQAAQGGLSTSGSAFQSDIALRGQALAQQGMNERDRLNQIADVERRLSEAQQLRDMGIATAQSEAELTFLTDQLQNLRDTETRTREDAQVADAQAREDFNNEILANRSNLLGFAQKLEVAGEPSWKINAVLAAREQKKADLNLDDQGRPLPVDTTPQLTSSSAALELWQQLGVANEAISRALGVPVGQRYTDTSRLSGGSGSGGGTPNPDDDPKVILSYLENTLRGTTGASSADLLVQLNDLGFFENLTKTEIQNLNKKFGVTELMLEQAENRRDAFTSQAPYKPQGIPLPSQTGGLYGILNNNR